MRKFALLLLSAIVCITSFAQKEVTKFMGIPVDGSKSKMVKALKAKGFKTFPFDHDMLVGEFNGEDVLVKIETN